MNHADQSDFLRSLVLLDALGERIHRGLELLVRQWHADVLDQARAWRDNPSAIPVELTTPPNVLKLRQRVVTVDRKWFGNQFKKNGDVVSAIYLLVDDDEKPLNEAYEIEVWVVMRTEDYKDLTKRDQATGLLNDLESAFEAATGIEVKGTDVKSEQDVSLDDIRVMKRWDFDDLTLKDGLQEEIVLNE